MIDNRPIYLNLLKIRLPLNGMISFAHRISGVLLFLSLPFMVYLLDQSVASQESFDNVRLLLSQPVIQLIQILILWSLAHHFFAGIRFLLIDIEVGVNKQSSRLGSWLVVTAELIALSAILYGVLR